MGVMKGREDLGRVEYGSESESCGRRGLGIHVGGVRGGRTILGGITPRSPPSQP